MNTLFLKIIHMSISASWLVLAVLILRLVLKKAPKWVNVLLWGIVAVKLTCPFAIESPISLMPDSIGNGALISQWRDDYMGDLDVHHSKSVYYDAAIDTGREPISDGKSSYYVVTKHEQLDEPSTIENTVIPVLSAVWLAGITALLIYTAISYWQLRRKVDTAILCKDNIFQSEHVVSPFVLGIIKPQIYLPFKLDEANLEHVIAHEQAHIRRKDHWWKPLGFLLLILHWFNPLLWLAYMLLCRDIELACDEKVIKELGNEQRADYTQALVSCSMSHHMIAVCPFAFGEAGVKERVKSVMNYKKPTSWMILASVIVCIVVAVCFLTNPKQDRFRLKIVVPAGSQEQFVYADEEISPLGNHITITSGDGLGDTEVLLNTVQVKTKTAYEPRYLTPGMPVKMEVEKGGWFKIGVHMQNHTNQDKIVYVNVENVEIRTEETNQIDLAQYRTAYLGDAPKVSQIAQLLPYPKDYHYASIELQTNTEPYELIVFLSGKEYVQKEDFEHCAATAFDLIGNMGVISFRKAETNETIASFTRNTEPAEDALDMAISAAILEHNKEKYFRGAFVCESHIVFATEEGSNANADMIDTLTVYATALYHEYEKAEGTVQQVSGGCTPVALTFAMEQNGTYTLQEYWEPRDGSYYAKDIRAKFPKEVAEDVLNHQEYIEDLQTQNYHKALEALNNTDGLKPKIAE